jgi:hypothetical protein
MIGLWLAVTLFGSVTVLAAIDTTRARRARNCDDY